MDNFFTKEQKRQIDDMELERRVELIRGLFWNDLKFNSDYTEVEGLEDFRTSPENSEYFLMGATAMFDVALQMTANHWHGDPEVNKLCQMENDYVYNVMDIAFEKINPDKMAKWKEIMEAN